MVLNDLVDSFCYSQKNAGLKGLSGRHCDRLRSFYIECGMPRKARKIILRNLLELGTPGYGVGKRNI